MPRSGSKLAAVTALTGSVLMFTGTMLHPSMADPNDSAAAFTEYSKFQPWVAIHLMQLAGIVLIMASLVLLSRRLTRGPAADWTALATAGAIATIALYAALQAVDGIALHAMVNNWATSSGPEKAVAFQAALAVRQIEIGLSSVSSLAGGLTFALYGIALLADRRAHWWVGTLALVGGLPTAFAGGVIAYTGFSDLELVVNMISSAVLILWMIALGISAWRGSSYWQVVQQA